MAKISMRLVFSFLCISVLMIVGCKKTKSYTEINGIIWNTTYHIKYNSDKNLTDSVLATLKDVGRSVSAFDTSSVVSKVNRNISVVLDSHFRRVFAKSVEVNAVSGGAFDPTLAPLINAWGFGYEREENDSVDVDSIMEFVGISKCRMVGDKIVKDDDRIAFNFSAIAKGYGCDCVADMFRRNGVSDFIIEIGGEIVASGLSPNGKGWNVAIETPSENDNRKAQIIVQFTNKAMATSGNYRNYRYENGQRIAHIIDPKSGRPKQSDVVSATVVADNCMEADAYATSFMVMGAAEAQSVAASHNFAVFLILSDGTTWSSDEFEKLKSGSVN